VKQFTAAALGAIAGLGIASSAYADNRPTMTSVCKDFPCIYDAHGTIVGIPADPFHVDRQIGGTWYMLDVDQTGVQSNVLFFYTTADCTGQRYFDNIQMIPFAWYDGSVIWIPDTRSTISAKYHSYAYGTPLYCTAIDSYGPVLLQAAGKGETRAFYGPLKVQ
jgi:hypothetical protein